MIEHFIFRKQPLTLSPVVTSWQFREGVFICVSVVLGAFTHFLTRHRSRAQQARLKEELAADRVKELALENEGRESMALDGANVGFFEWDTRSDTSKWSAGFYQMHELEQGTEASYEVWRSKVHPDDVDRVEGEISHAVSTNGSFACEYRVNTQTGVRWILCQGSPTASIDGVACKVTGFCGDITRRKQAELALMQSEKLAVACRLSASIAHEINNPHEAAINLLYLTGPGLADRPQEAAYVEKASHQLERVAQIAKQTLSFSRTHQPNVTCHISGVIEGTLRLLGFPEQSQLEQWDLQARRDAEVGPVRIT